MIGITITRTKSGRLKSFEMSGHALFADRGKDIVCAGVSAVSVGAINAVHELTGVTPDIEHRADGFLRCVIPEELPVDIERDVQLIIEAMVVSLRSIEETYGKHIKITFKKQEVE